jgi:aminomethyltransferase
MTEPVKSVLHAVQEQAGATFLEDGGWLWTSTLGDPQAEYDAVRTSAGMWDVFALQKWEVRGPDAARAVQRTFAGNVSTLAVGQVRYAPFVDPSGAMVDDGTVYKHGEHHYWVMTNGPEFGEYLAGQTADAGITDYSIENRTLAMPVVSVQGPRSREILQGLTSTDLGQLRYFRFLPERQTVAGVPVWVLRTGFSGELGFELIPDPDRAVELWQALAAVGVRPFGLDAVEMLRVEAGLVIVGVDYQPGETSPLDVSMDRMLALSDRDVDADFVGKHVLAAAAAAPPRRFRTLLVTGDDVPEYGAPVYRGDEAVGTCTSPVASPKFGVIGLAVLRTDQASNGNVLEVAVGGGRAKATVTDLSVHDPDKRKPRG